MSLLYFASGYFRETKSEEATTARPAGGKFEACRRVITSSAPLILFAFCTRLFALYGDGENFRISTQHRGNFGRERSLLAARAAAHAVRIDFYGASSQIDRCWAIGNVQRRRHVLCAMWERKFNKQ